MSMFVSAIVCSRRKEFRVSERLLSQIRSVRVNEFRVSRHVSHRVKVRCKKENLSPTGIEPVTDG